MSRLSLSCQPYTLELNHQFTVAAWSRATTPVVLVELHYEGITGYGEASMPPYLGESTGTVVQFLSGLDFSPFSDPEKIDLILDYVDSAAPGNNAAKAAVDIALHDLAGKIRGMPLYRIWGLDPQKTPPSSFTIGIDSPGVMVSRIGEARDFGMIKIKLGTAFDKEIIKAIRAHTSRPLIADVNQGWKDKNDALEMAFWLKENGVILLEQPLPKENRDDLSWLSRQSPIPIIADEGIKRLSDLENNLDVYNGVNVKLMKSTGLREAKKIIGLALKNKMVVMIGCMTETSCAVAAASHLSPLCHFADLDGPFLIRNNPFENISVQNGGIVIPDKPGIGVDLKHNPAK